MNKPSINIQDGFLFQSLKDGRAMSIELVTGKHLEGKIRRIDRFAVVVESAVGVGGQQVRMTHEGTRQRRRAVNERADVER